MGSVTEMIKETIDEADQAPVIRSKFICIVVLREVSTAVRRFGRRSSSDAKEWAPANRRTSTFSALKGMDLTSSAAAMAAPVIPAEPIGVYDGGGTPEG
ncbi:MAG: hypothetical protein ACLVJ6_13295 [Merdibacter sp.]